MKRNKVYIAAPFRRDSVREIHSHSAAYGELLDIDKISLLEAIEAVFLDDGWVTCLPHRDEGSWGKTYYEPHAIAALCLRHVDTSDLVVAIPGRSRGVHVELGWAGSRRIPIIAFVLAHEENSTLLPGLGRVSGTQELPRPGEIAICEVASYDQIPGKLATILGRMTTGPSLNEHITAVVDLGSNSIKFSLFSVRQGRRPKPLASDRNSIALADSVRNDGRISSEKLDDIRTTLYSFAQKFDVSSVNVVAVGTEALRSADNLADVRRLVADVLGTELRLLSQRDEAIAVANAVRAAIDVNLPVASLNLGASSTQVVANVLDGDHSTRLFRFGTKDITARTPWTNALADAEWNAIRKYVDERVASRELQTLGPVEYLFHTGGELDFLLRCGVQMETCRLSHSHVSMLSKSAFEAFAREFAARHPKDIGRTTGLQEAWLAGSIASNAIALAVADAVGVNTIVPSNLNVVDGLLS